MSHGQGARLYDVDGREYIDWMMAFGALPLGHAHPKVVETVTREVARGTHFATALEVEVEVAEMLVGLLPHVDKVRFANTGTEAAMAAFRLARGHTGRRKIIKFEGHYHGWSDAVLINTNPLPPTMLGHPNDPIRIPDSSGIPEEAWKDTIVVRWNDIEALERQPIPGQRGLDSPTREGFGVSERGRENSTLRIDEIIGDPIFALNPGHSLRQCPRQHPARTHLRGLHDIANLDLKRLDALTSAVVMHGDGQPVATGMIEVGGMFVIQGGTGLHPSFGIDGEEVCLGSHATKIT
jgi:hypothetical protein